MNKTQSTNIDARERLAASDETLASLLDCGVPTARKIASDASAVFYVGRRKFNNVVKIQQYINSISE